MGTQLPSRKGAQPPNFRSISAVAKIWQMAGWIKMSLGTELGLSPGEFVLDGAQLPVPQKGHSPQILGPCLLWPNGCMYQDITWYRGRPQPGRHCVTWGPSSPFPKGAQPPIFGQCSKRLDGSRCHLVWR